MKISKFFIRVKSAVYAQCAIRKYRRRFRRMTDDELKVIIARERVCKGGRVSAVITWLRYVTNVRFADLHIAGSK